MKPKNFALATLLIAIVALGIWWLMRPSAITAEKTAEAPKPVATEAKIQPPKFPPATPGSAEASTTSDAPKEDVSAELREMDTAVRLMPPVVQSTAYPPPTSSNPQADLKTALLDIAHLIRTGGDPEAFLEKYTSPDELGPEKIQQIRADIQRRVDMGAQGPFMQRLFQQTTEDMAREYESLENQIPTYNDTGDVATYTYTKNYQYSAPAQITRTFVKINGKWYYKENTP